MTDRARDLRRRLDRHEDLDLRSLPIRKGHSRRQFQDEIVGALLAYESARAHAIAPWRLWRLRVRGGRAVRFWRGMTTQGQPRSREMRNTQDRALAEALGYLLRALLRAHARHVVRRPEKGRDLSGREFARSYLPQILTAAGVAPPRYGGHRRELWTIAAVERAVKRATSGRRGTFRRWLEEDDERWRDLRDRCDDPKMRAELDATYILPSPAMGRERILRKRSSDLAAD